MPHVREQIDLNSTVGQKSTQNRFKTTVKSSKKKKKHGGGGRGRGCGKGVDGEGEVVHAQCFVSDPRASIICAPPPLPVLHR